MKAVLALAPLCLAGGEAGYDRAVIDFYMSSEGQLLASPVTVEVAKKDIPKLMAFFPGLRERLKGSKPAGWTARTEVRFLGKNQRPLVVRVNVYETIWTWGNGNGDFRPAGGLSSYLVEMQAKSKPLKKSG